MHHLFYLKARHSYYEWKWHDPNNFSSIQVDSILQQHLLYNNIKHSYTNKSHIKNRDCISSSDTAGIKTDFEARAGALDLFQSFSNYPTHYYSHNNNKNQQTPNNCSA